MSTWGSIARGVEPDIEPGQPGQEIGILNLSQYNKKLMEYEKWIFSCGNDCPDGNKCHGLGSRNWWFLRWQCQNKNH